MSHVLDALRLHAADAAVRIAIDEGARCLTYAELAREVERLALQLRSKILSSAPLALLADNGIDWVIADLAALAAQLPLVPLPTFFSNAQLCHALASAGVREILTDQPQRIAGLQPASAERIDGSALVLLHLDAVAEAALPRGTNKITFTSGTTAEPKGVCLTSEQIERTAIALSEATEATPNDSHLCLLPLATLLENIGGIYAPLLAGARIIVPSSAITGLAGSSGLDIRALIGTLGRMQPTSLILVPQLLAALVQAARAGMPLPRSLRFVAVGGAPISRHTLDAAEQCGLPVYEGYGLSECASVVALNRPSARCIGSVGQPLPHVSIEIAADGEILVRGVDGAGYLGERTRVSDLVATGDLGYIDANGFLHVTGRKKSVFITAFGRNVAPEWVERELVAQAPIAQAALFGDGRPFNTAIVVPRPGTAASAIDNALAAVNSMLPDYAQVRTWIPARSAFSADNGMSTPNGRLRRAPIFAAHAEQLAAVYRETVQSGDVIHDVFVQESTE